MGYQNLYFLAIVPPEKIQRDVIAIQEDISLRFQTSAALKIVPHITLKAPFKFSSSAHAAVQQWFECMDFPFKSFDLKLDGFAAFSNPNHPVIYLRPKENYFLMELQRQILTQFSERFPLEPIIDLERSFRPHMTLAYRDLKPDFFKKAWEEFSGKTYEVSFPVNKFYLLMHDGTQWNAIGSYDLG